MSYLVLARKYRPQTFEQVIGQEHVTRTLTNAVSAGRVAHAILFSGPRGTGKTTIARILAKIMNCAVGDPAVPCNQCRSCREITAGNAADVFEIDGASNNSVDQVRELRENIKYMPQHSPYKIYIIDEVHMLSIAAFNALLKTLEEPPAHVMFLFATTESHKIPVTILSRCQRHDLKRISVETIVNHMAGLCEREEVTITADSLNLIAREAGGCMRDALSLLDQILGGANKNIEPETVPEMLGITGRKVIMELSRTILQRNLPAFLTLLDEIFLQGKDLKKVYADLIEHFRNLLVVRLGSRETELVDTPLHEIETMREITAETTATHLGQLLDRLLQEESVIRYSSQPRVAFEVAVIKMIQVPPALSIETLIEKLDQLQQNWTGDMPAAAPAPANMPAGSAPQDALSPAKAPPAGHPRASVPAAPSGPAAAPAEPNPETPGQVWEALRAAITQKIPSMVSPLSNSQLTRLTQDSICITITGNPFAVNRIKSKRKELAAICNGFFNRPIKLELEMNIEAGEEPGKKAEENRRKQDQAARHPLVADAVEIFDGDIIDVKVL